MTLFRDAALAFRSFRQARLASLTVVSTVGLGLGLVAAVFTFLNVFLFRVDAVPGVRELYAIERPRTAAGDKVGLTRGAYESMRREAAAGFVDLFAMVPEVDARLDGRALTASLVTGNFFQVLGVHAQSGRVLNPADDTASSGEPVMVLSHSGRSRMFGADADVVGRSVQLGGVAFQVVGVMPDGFRGLMIGAPDFWTPLSQLPVLQPALAAREAALELDIVGRLRPGTSRQAALGELIAWDARQDRPAGTRAPGVTLVPRWGTAPQPLEVMAVFLPLLVAFGLILLIGCANVASLLLARGVARQREIGIRLSLGASRGQIVRQLLTENLMLALAAAAVGYAVSRLVLDGAIRALVTTMPPDIGDVRLAMPGADWRVAVFLVAGAVVSCAMFGLAPAVHASRLELVRVMRGGMTRDGRPGRARQWLIGLQVTASALLLVCAGVFLRSAGQSSSADAGLRTADTMLIEVTNEPKRAQVLDALARDPLVAEVAAAWPDPVGGSRPAQATSGNTRSAAAYRFVSAGYFSLLDVGLVRGRAFTPAETGPAATVAIVTDSLARRLWPNGDPIGQVLQLTPDPETTMRDRVKLAATTSVTIVGIARDVNAFRLGEAAGPNVYLPVSARDAGTALVVRARGEPGLARQALLQRLTIVDPNLGGIVTLETIAGLPTYFLNVGFWLTVLLGALALVLTLSGLFSVLSYLVVQRRKEIGVRMALGATPADVSALVLADTARPVGFGLLAGAAIAAGLAVALIASPAAEAAGAFVRVLDPVAYAGALSVIAAACGAAALVPTLQAARVEPLATLREE